MRLNQIHKYNYQVGYDNIDMYSVMYHPEYLKVCDKARNKAFEDYGYPVEQQLKDKVGFTIGGINCRYSSPILMGEKLSVFTKCVEANKNRCKVFHYITLETDDHVDIGDEASKKKILFSAEYTLVLVSIDKISEFPLSRQNVKSLEVREFSEQIKDALKY